MCIRDSPWTDPFSDPPKTGTQDFHGGIDFLLREGTSIVAAAPGVVYEIQPDNNGYNMLLRHWDGINHWVTFYGHLTPGSARVSIGERVTRGQEIALSGSSGAGNVYKGRPIPHLDFTFVRGERYRTVNCIDPFRDTTGTPFPLSSPVSYWTKDNDPRFSA